MLCKPFTADLIVPLPPEFLQDKGNALFINPALLCQVLFNHQETLQPVWRTTDGGWHLTLASPEWATSWPLPAHPTIWQVSRPLNPPLPPTWTLFEFIPRSPLETLIWVWKQTPLGLIFPWLIPRNSKAQHDSASALTWLSSHPWSSLAFPLMGKTFLTISPNLRHRKLRRDSKIDSTVLPTKCVNDLLFGGRKDTSKWWYFGGEQEMGE